MKRAVKGCTPDETLVPIDASMPTHSEMLESAYSRESTRT